MYNQGGLKAKTETEVDYLGAKENIYKHFGLRLD